MLALTISARDSRYGGVYMLHMFTISYILGEISEVCLCCDIAKYYSNHAIYWKRYQLHIQWQSTAWTTERFRKYLPIWNVQMSMGMALGVTWPGIETHNLQTGEQML